MKKKAKQKLEAVKESEKLMSGVVNVFNKTLGLIIDRGKIKIIIPMEEIEAYQKVEDDNYTHLTGRQVIFVIKEIDAETNTLIASRKRAQEIVYPTIMEVLQKGQPIDAILTHIMPHGAYLDIRGISVFLKNMHYSEDASGIAESYKPGDTMSVLFHKISDNGVIHVTVPHKVKKDCALSEKDLGYGGTAFGKVTGIHPAGIFVTVMPGVTVLCKTPTGDLADYAFKEYKTTVSIVITGKKPELDGEGNPIPDKFKYAGLILQVIS